MSAHPTNHGSGTPPHTSPPPPTGEWVRKILLGIGWFMLALVIIAGVLPTLPTVPRYVVLGLLILGIVITFRRKSPSTPTAGGGHGGGHGHGPGTLAWLGIAIAVIIGAKAILSLGVLTWDMYQRRNEDQLGPRATMDGQRKTHFYITAQPDGEVPITVYNGWQCELSLSSTNEPVWVHYPNAEPVLVRKGDKQTYRKYYGPYQVGLRSGLDRPVVVEVKLTPVVRK